MGLLRVDDVELFSDRLADRNVGRDHLRIPVGPQFEIQRIGIDDRVVVAA